jgi:hypothetical protein
MKMVRLPMVASCAPDSLVSQGLIKDEQDGITKSCMDYYFYEQVAIPRAPSLILRSDRMARLSEPHSSIVHTFTLAPRTNTMR